MTPAKTADTQATVTFDSFGLPETLLKAIAKIGYTEATPIQAQSIPPALKGRDVLGTASTGTGKTAAFALPMITHLINNPRAMALVMTPTRELATQVMATMMPLLLLHKEIRTACLIGGESMGKQIAQLKGRPRLIVGTPGRINDHLERGMLRLDPANFLVLDETDRMLDMGFGIQIVTIIERMSEQRQTLMFSATLPPQIIKMSAQYLDNPVRISVGTVNKPATNIKQEIIRTSDGEKYTELTAQLEKRTGSVIIFVKTKYGTEKLATRLAKAGIKADAIHGDLRQNKRDRVIQSFRDQKFRVLVATDVAARGLDIPHIEHVINYDMPQSPEDYIHRIGRTARAGATGEAVNLLTAADGGKWKAIQRLMNPEEGRGEKSYDQDDAAGKSSKPRRAGGGASRFGKPRRFDRDQRDMSGTDDRYGRGGDRRRSSHSDERSDRPERSSERPYRAAKTAPRGNRFDRDDRRSAPREDNWVKKDYRDEGRSESRRPSEDRGGFRKKTDRFESRGGYSDNRDSRDNVRSEGRGEYKPASKAGANRAGFKSRSAEGAAPKRSGGFGAKKPFRSGGASKGKGSFRKSA